MHSRYCSQYRVFQILAGRDRLQRNARVIEKTAVREIFENSETSMQYQYQKYKLHKKV